MNLKKLIEKHLGEYLDDNSKVRVEYYYRYAPDTQYIVSFYSASNEMTYSTDTFCGEIEKGLEIIRNRLQKR